MPNRKRKPGQREPNDQPDIWFVAALAAGATRRSPTSEDPDETVVEEALRDAGLTPYLPRMRKEIVHHRTHKPIVRTFPLFTGYIFVGTTSAAPRFRQMLEAKGVSRLLGSDGFPMSLAASQVSRFMDAEEAMAFDDTREARIRRKQEGRTRVETIRMRFPPGSRTRINDGPFAGFGGQVRSVLGKGVVEVMVEIFGRLSPVELEVGMLQPAA
jgi:transcription antitermination factor NusG